MPWLLRCHLTDAAHNRSILVWDVPSTVARGETFAIRIGVKCEGECSPEDWTIEIRDQEGSVLANAAIGAEPWSGTSALYHAKVELPAPEIEGLFSWKVVAPATACDPLLATSEDVSHAQARADFNLRVVPDADCRLQVIAVDRASQRPVQGLRVVIHPYRAITDENGVAELSLPKGHYRVFLSGKNFLPFRVDGELTSDQTIRAQLEVDIGPSDAEVWS